MTFSMFKEDNSSEQNEIDCHGERKSRGAIIRARAIALAGQSYKTIAAIRSTLELEGFPPNEIDAAFVDAAFFAEIASLLAAARSN